MTRLGVKIKVSYGTSRNTQSPLRDTSPPVDTTSPPNREICKVEESYGRVSNKTNKKSLKTPRNPGKPLPRVRLFKEILVTKVKGTVRWLNVKDGYGFINRHDTEEDVYIHQSGILKNYPWKAVRSVGDGEEVECDRTKRKGSQRFAICT